MPGLAACQSAHVQAVLPGQAWVRRLRRQTLPARCVSQISHLWRAQLVGLFNGLAEIVVAVCVQATPPSCPSLLLVAELRNCASCHSAEDCRRHAFFMTTSSNEPSWTEQARVRRPWGLHVSICVGGHLLSTRPTQTALTQALSSLPALILSASAFFAMTISPK